MIEKKTKDQVVGRTAMMEVAHTVRPQNDMK